MRLYPDSGGNEESGVVSEGEAYYLSLLTFAAIWAVGSAWMLIASARERNKPSAWFWAAMFAVSSLAAAYSFGRLVSSGDAA